MRKRFLTTLNLLGTPLLVAACAIAGSTGADRMRRAFIVLFLIASIGCSGESPVAPSPVAEIGTTPNNVAAALEPTASDATFTNVAIGLDVPVRRATHNTTAWTFNLLSNSGPNVLAHSNKYRLVEFTTPETGDRGTHWYVQFRSRETYNGQPHERGIWVEENLESPTKIPGFWANARYIVRARSYAQVGRHDDAPFYAIGNSLTEVDRFTTPRCPNGTQARDQLRSGEANPENPYRCELIPQPPLHIPVVPEGPVTQGMITEDAANAWGTTNNLNNFAVVSKRSSQGTVFARVFIFSGGNHCPATYTFRTDTYTPTTDNMPYRNGCTHQSIL